MIDRSLQKGKQKKNKEKFPSSLVRSHGYIFVSFSTPSYIARNRFLCKKFYRHAYVCMYVCVYPSIRARTYVYVRTVQRTCDLSSAIRCSSRECKETFRWEGERIHLEIYGTSLSNRYLFLFSIKII